MRCRQVDASTSLTRFVSFLFPIRLREFPGELEKILVWFRDYKMPDGKPANAFGYDNKCLDKDFAMKVIDETHGFYNALKSGARENTEGLSLT